MRSTDNRQKEFENLRQKEAVIVRQVFYSTLAECGEIKTDPLHHYATCHPVAMIQSY